MPTRHLGPIQSALNILNSVEKSINELKYYKKYLESPNHSNSDCSSVCTAIDKLGEQVLSVAGSLLYYGQEYQRIDEEMAYSNDPNYESDGICYDFSYTRAEEHKKGFWERTLNQIFLGDFTEDSSWLGTTGSIGLSFTGLDAPMDFRDMVANAKNGKWGWAALNFVSLFPVVGSLGKIGSTAIKHGDEIVEGGSQIIKHGDDFIEGGSQIIKHSDDFVEAGSTVLKHGDEVVDVLGSASSSGRKVLAETASKNKYILSDGVFSVVDESGNTINHVNNVGVIKDYSYVKKSPDALNKARIDFNTKHRPEFIKRIAEDNLEDLKKLGLSDSQIDLMRREGTCPTGFQVHHKIPLADGGENTFDNFILIDEESHRVFSGYQRSFENTNEFKTSGQAIKDWVFPTGSVYVP